MRPMVTACFLCPEALCEGCPDGSRHNRPGPAPYSVATERLSSILGLEIALLRAQTCHSQYDPNQHLFAAIAAPVAALVDDARLRVRHVVATS